MKFQKEGEMVDKVKVDQEMFQAGRLVLAHHNQEVLVDQNLEQKKVDLTHQRGKEGTVVTDHTLKNLKEEQVILALFHQRKNDLLLLIKSEKILFLDLFLVLVHQKVNLVHQKVNLVQRIGVQVDLH